MDEERIGLFLDYENLAIGAREHLGGSFDFKPIADALAERGRVVVRRAYADWSYFDDDKRSLTRLHVELIEIPQRMGAVRKNAADIKLAVDAIELAFEREYITTFVIGTGDSDFTPLMHKLRELNKKVIGIGVKGSTSDLLPPACDEFLFYDHLEGVNVPKPTRARAGRGSKSKAAAAKPAPPETPETPEPTSAAKEDVDIGVLITQTLSGMKRGATDTVLASGLKRALLRKDATFNEADHGFRGFTELLRHLATQGVVELSTGLAPGDPQVDFPRSASGEQEAFDLLGSIVTELTAASGPPPLSGMKNELRKRKSGFTEKRFGYGGFLQFCKAARARGVIEMEWDTEADDYLLRPAKAD